MSYDAIVMELRAKGVPLDKAEEVARRECGHPEPIVAARNIREKDEQRAVVRLFREAGYTVRSTSQARPSKIARGFPDLFVTHKHLRIGFFFETKRQVGGVLSEFQREFAADCERCGIRCYRGDRYEAQRLIVSAEEGL